MSWSPCVVKRQLGEFGVEVRLGHELLDDYLRFVAARCRPNTVLASGFDLLVFFTFVGKDPALVTTADVLDFIADQRAPRRGGNVIGLHDREVGLSARTVRRRLATLSGLFGYLTARGVMAASPVPSGLTARSPGSRGGARVPLIRTPYTLPRLLNPTETIALLGVLRTVRDAAMVQAMLLGGLRRCEVLGLRLEDIHLGDRRLFIACGKGGHQRIVPVAGRFFTTLSSYLQSERRLMESNSDAVFLVLKGPTRGAPLSAAGLDEILRGAKSRAGLNRLTCHMLRHTCLTRLREAGMALEAVQAQAGHRSIESTRIYLHLSNGWLAEEYHKAISALEHDLDETACAATLRAVR